MVRMRRPVLLSLLLALALQALGVVQGDVPSLDRGVRTAPVCPTGPPVGTPVHLVADLETVQVRDSASRGPLIAAADAIVASGSPPVTYRGDGDPDPLRYLYDEGVALRRVTGVLGYAYAATHDPKYLDTLAGVVVGVAAWPDWNQGHPLDTAQVGTAVALAYSWTRDRLTPQQREAVTGVLVERLLAPYACDGGGLARYRIATGNQVTVVGSAVVLAGLALRADEPQWSATAVRAGADALRRFASPDGSGRSLADGPTAEGLMYTTYEAANLALLHATLRAGAADPDLTGALAGTVGPLDPLADWNERCGRVAEPNVEDAWDVYPWVDRATALAAMAASPAAGGNVRALLDALQQAGRLTVPGHGTVAAPDGIAELVLSSLTPGSAVTPPVQAHASGGRADARLYGCATNGSMYALLTGIPNDAPHGHADVGNVVVKHGEQTVLADLGQRDYGFRGAPVWRASTKAHTTIGVLRPDGAVDQQPGGSGAVSADGNGLLMTSSTALEGVPTWERRVSLTESSVRIADRLTSSTAVPLSVSYLIAAPRSAVTDAGGGTLQFGLADGSTWQLVLPAGAAVTVTDAAASPPYVDAPSLDPLAQSHTLVTLTTTVEGTLDLAAEMRRVG